MKWLTAITPAPPKIATTKQIRSNIFPNQGFETQPKLDICPRHVNFPFKNRAEKMITIR